MDLPHRPLVLHFDVNKTIVICDTVKGVNSDKMLNSLLSEVCWGTWDHHVDLSACDSAEFKLHVAATWKLIKGPTTEVQAGLLTYAELLEDVLCMDQKDRQTLKTQFTKPGHPGECVCTSHEELRNQLKLPEGVKLEGAAAVVGEGFHFLLPSFLNLIQYLQQTGRNFRLIFRTFGSDIGDVIQEFNLFCEGRHPCFPGVPAELSKRAISLPHGSGEWFRDEGGFHLSLCMHCNGLQLVRQFHGNKQCAEALHRKLFGDPQTLTLALLDYHPHWKEHNETDDSGKLLLLMPRESDPAVHIFFDDNIERDRAHIVDARNAATGEPLPFGETQGVHLIRAEPFEAIRDPQYFIAALAAAEASLCF